MTYCAGILVREGLVMMADTRTNAGLDDISTFRKLHLFSWPGDRTFVLMTAGNLSITQTVVSSRVQVSEADIDAKAKQKLTAANSFDYILKEVIFIGKGSSARTGQANQYRKSFQGCDAAVQLSLSYTDAAVIDVRRRRATQLPEPIAKELAGLNVGGITKPRVVENGVSMLAVCSKSEAKDTTFIKGNIQQSAGNDALKAEAAKYLKETKTKAKIIYE